MKTVALWLLAGTLALWTGTALAASASDAQQAIASAKAAVAKTAAIHYLWLSTPKLLKEAEAAQKAGKYALAVQKAQAAKATANGAYAQGEAQAQKYGVTLGKDGLQMKS